MVPPEGLTTKPHATFQCPHCAILSIHNKLPIQQGYSEGRKVENGPVVAFFQADHTHFIVRCVNCQKDTYLLYRSKFTDRSSNNELAELPAEVRHQYPVSTPVAHPAVNAGVSSAAVEAEKCLSVGAFNACAVMTRRAMHSLCKDKGGTGKDLFAQLEDLKSRQLITPDLWEWAEELRVLGRNGAHPEWEDVSQDDAEYSLNFLREIIRFVYILPYERSQKRVKETSKKA